MKSDVTSVTHYQGRTISWNEETFGTGLHCLDILVTKEESHRFTFAFIYHVYAITDRPSQSL